MSQTRNERLAAQLRANLQRRKSQARARRDEEDRPEKRKEAAPRPECLQSDEDGRDKDD